MIQNETLRAQLEQVLRLKGHADMLRDEAVKLLPPNAAPRDYAQFFGIEWAQASRFFVEKKPGAVKTVLDPLVVKLGDWAKPLASEMLTLGEELSDYQKGFSRFDVRSIKLGFALTDVYRRTATRLTTTQFADFFGNHRIWVMAVLSRKLDSIGDISIPAETDIRRVLAGTDWAKAQPPSKIKARQEKIQRLIEANGRLKRHFPSVNALVVVLGVHRISYVNALAGKAKGYVVDDILAKAARLEKTLGQDTQAASVPEASLPEQLAEVVRKLRERMTKEQMLKLLHVDYRDLDKCLAGNGKSERLQELIADARKFLGASDQMPIPAVQPLPITEPGGNNSQLKDLDPHQFVSSFTSSLLSMIQLLKAAHIPPSGITDGQRDNIIRAINELLALGGIDKATLKRLQQAQGSLGGDNVLSVLEALSGVSR